MLNMSWGLAQLSADVLVTWVVADRMKGQGTRMPWVVFWQVISGSTRKLFRILGSGRC